jgi:Zn-dependent M28 family amino/carboxypeptidase
MRLRDAIGDIWLSSDLMDDFEAICDTGGRVAGTASEEAARQYLRTRLGELTDDVTEHAFTVEGLSSQSHAVRIPGDGRSAVLESYPLLNTPSVDGRFAVIDLGQGTPADFAAAGSAIEGKAVLVRHEFPFSTGHVHRGVKYALAKEAGAAAFLIGNKQPGAGAVSGSAGSNAPDDIPGFGLSFDAARTLSTLLAAHDQEIELVNVAGRHTWIGRNLIARFPGTGEKHVVLSAHIDGHGLAESAMDNASGLVTVLETARRLGEYARSQRIGLTVALFTFEEWSLTGSARWLADLSEQDRGRILCNINVDTPVGYPRVFGLTASDPLIRDLLREATSLGGTPIHQIPAYTSNSDHYNFLEAGIPAVRLIGGYNDPAATSRLLLTAQDVRGRVEPLDLRHAAIVTTTIVWQALQRE